MIIMTERYPQELRALANHYEHIPTQQQFMDRCNNVPTLKIAKDQMHFNQADNCVINPLYGYRAFRGEWPAADYIEMYLVNAWLTMQFLETHQLCVNPGF